MTSPQMRITDLTPCWQSSEHLPYSWLNQITVFDETSWACQCTAPCCGCQRMGGHGIDIDGRRFFPRMGLEVEMLKELCNELQMRKVQRGSIAQLYNAQRAQEVSKILEAKIQIIMDDLQVSLNHEKMAR
jgi:hypothetical protein